ncbi:MFS transporter [Gordonia polyisoprenivorans]|uniref:MFS transporter n=1 Tax=Gordonia polyisoprenivorans TaxID=84595 RepID=UPI001B8C4D37|nr:MFS transporter [Gordonia polyisoprenivorans]QUD83997.1 MFS transporter [Gordonia polyisoprenivorans]
MSGPAVASQPLASKPFNWQLTTPLYIGAALNPINSSLIATALVPIAVGVHVSIGQTAVLVSALYLASAIAQPTAGKAAEVFGPRRVFLAGILLVLVGGIVGGLAPGLLVLIVSRVLIGLGTSCAYPTAMVLIRRRARAAGLEKPPGGVLGGLMIAGVATASLGLPIGGVLVQFLGWRSVFLINVPVALIALVATLMWVPRDEPTERRTARRIASDLDMTGILGFALAMTGLLLFLSGLPNPNWTLLAVTIALWALEVWWELRATSPFFDVRLLGRNVALTRTLIRFGLVMLCGYVVLYGITQWLEASQGMSELGSGLLLIPMTLVSGLVIVPFSRRNLVRGPIIGAALACVTAAICALFLPTPAWLVVTLAVTILLGFAQGAASSNQLALYSQVTAEQLGTASGLMRSFGYLGSIASSAITGIVYRTNVTDTGVTTIAWIMVGASVVLLCISIFDRTLRRTAGAAT